MTNVLYWILSVSSVTAYMPVITVGGLTSDKTIILNLLIKKIDTFICKIIYTSWQTKKHSSKKFETY